MYHTILVLLDGSEFSERSLPIASELAAACRAELVLVRGVSASPPVGADAIGVQVAAVEAAEKYLEWIAERLSRGGVQCQIAVPYAKPPEAIRLEEELRGADLVVMCTHGRSGLGRWVYGSVAEAVLAQSKAPILLVRPTGLQAAIRRGMDRPTFLVPLDGSEFAEAALPHAVGLARVFGGAVQLLRVVVPPSVGQPSLDLQVDSADGVDETLDAEHHEAERYLAEVMRRLRDLASHNKAAAHGDHEPEELCVDAVVRRGWPPDAILAQAQEAGANLIVMSTHGRTGLAQLLMGSVALEVLHHTLLPVLLLPQSAQADQPR